MFGFGRIAAAPLLLHNTTGQFGSVDNPSDGVYVVTFTEGLAFAEPYLIVAQSDEGFAVVTSEKTSLTKFTLTRRRTDTGAATNGNVSFALFTELP